MAFTLNGYGSGLDIQSMVRGLVSAEGQPKTALLNRRESQAEAQLSAIGSLKSALNKFNDSVAALQKNDAFQLLSATSADESVFTVSADSSAVAGSYAIEVQNLAKAQKLASSGFASADSVVGTGTLTISVGPDSFSLNIDATNNTLAGVRDAINEAADNTGVSATIINVDDGAGGSESRLVLSSKETGTVNELTITVVDDDGNNSDMSGLSQLVYDPAGSGASNMAQQVAAEDAQILIDGLQVTSSSNTVENAIDGITLNLLAESAAAGEATSLDVSLDNEAIAEQIDGFVSAYNNLMSLMDDLAGYDSATGEGGVMQGDYITRMISNQIRSVLGSPVASVSSEFNTLSEFGIEIDEYGVMTLDPSRLDEMVSSDLTSLSKVFSNEDGVATRLDSDLTSYLRSDGLLEVRSNTLNETLNDVEDERLRLNTRLADYEAQLFEQFNAMDAIVAQLNSTGSYLSQQLAQLPGFATNKKS